MKRTFFSMIVVLFAVLVSAHFILDTPQGFYEKAFAVGSSVCHQIPSHSFINSGTQFPLCARCAGLYLGSFIGLAYFFTLGKRKGIPKKGFLILLLFLFLIWAADGVHSFLTDLLNKSYFYETTNLTRLVTGFGMGLVMSTALLTLFNLSTWKSAEDSALLFSVWQVAGYSAVSFLAAWILIFGNAILFQVLAYISIVTVIVIISMLYSIFWTIFLKKENSFPNWKSLGLLLTAGFATAILQITLLVMLRQWLLG